MSVLSQFLGGSSGNPKVPLGGLAYFPKYASNTVVYDGQTFLRSGFTVPAAQTALAGTAYAIPPGFINTTSEIRHLNYNSTSAVSYTGMSQPLNGCTWKMAMASSSVAALVWQSGGNRYISLTRDGGATWYFHQWSNASRYMYDGCFWNTTTLITVGQDSANNRAVVEYHSAASDTSVTGNGALQATVGPTGESFTAVDSSSPTAATGRVIVGGNAGSLLISSSPTASYSTLTNPFTGNTTQGITCIRYLNGTWYVGNAVGQIATAAGATPSSLTLRTSGAAAAPIYDFILGPNNEVHAVVQNASTTRKTADNGATWVTGITLRSSAVAYYFYKLSYAFGAWVQHMAGSVTYLGTTGSVSARSTVASPASDSDWVVSDALLSSNGQSLYDLGGRAVFVGFNSNQISTFNSVEVVGLPTLAAPSSNSSPASVQTHTYMRII